MKTLTTTIAIIIALLFASCKKDKIQGSDLTTKITYNHNFPDVGAKVYLFLLPEKPYIEGAIDIDSDWIENYPGELNNEYSKYSGIINNDGRTVFENVPYGHYVLAAHTHKKPLYIIKLIMIAEEDKAISYDYNTD